MECQSVRKSMKLGPRKSSRPAARNVEPWEAQQGPSSGLVSAAVSFLCGGGAGGFVVGADAVALAVRRRRRRQSVRGFVGGAGIAAAGLRPPDRTLAIRFVFESAKLSPLMLRANTWRPFFWAGAKCFYGGG